MNEFYFRYEYQYPDEDTPYGRLELEKYIVTKVTPKGVWVKYWSKYGCNSNKKHFVLNDSRKKYAYPTEKEAIQGFLFRKYRQMKLLMMQMVGAKEALELAEKLYSTMNTQAQG